MEGNVYKSDITLLKQLMERLLPMITEYHEQNSDPSTKVLEYLSPKDLQKAIDFQVGEKGTNLKEIIRLIQLVLKYSVRTSHPRFFKQHFTGTDPIGWISELLTALTNTNCHIYTAAPCFSIMEREVITSMSNILGFKTSKVDGIFCPGGTASNITSLMVARDQGFPHVRQKGWQQKDQPVCFTSDQSHYSISRSAMMSGLGMENCISIPCNKTGTMNTSKLQKSIELALEKGQKPFYVNAIAGSTVLGMFDDFQAISNICKKHSIWMHVDASWGGPAILSKTHNALMKGVELADSVTWSPHKGMGIANQCSALIINNHLGALERSNSSNAEYLFQKNEENEFTLGDKTLQCGRKNDALKFWLAWKWHGRKGF